MKVFEFYLETCIRTKQHGNNKPIIDYKSDEWNARYFPTTYPEQIAKYFVLPKGCRRFNLVFFKPGEFDIDNDSLKFENKMTTVVSKCHRFNCDGNHTEVIDALYIEGKRHKTYCYDMKRILFRLSDLGHTHCFIELDCAQ